MITVIWTCSSNVSSVLPDKLINKSVKRDTIKKSAVLTCWSEGTVMATQDLSYAPVHHKWLEKYLYYTLRV